MKKRTRRAGVLVAALALVGATATTAFGVTITAPSLNPFTVARLDPMGTPAPFDVTATGLTNGQPEFIQQCDGVSPSSLGYVVSDHCDFASGNTPVTAAGGTATFPANDAEHRLAVFKGDSPQSKFTCLSPHDADPGSGLPTFRNCQVRVSEGTPGDTSAQAYFTILLPDAQSAPTPIGGCQGAVLLGTITPALTDQTQLGVVAKTKILKDLTTKAAIGGTCATASRPGDPINPPGGGVLLHPKAEAASLLGNASCANGATAMAADANAAAAWPLNGKITWTMTELNALSKPWQIQADVEALGFNPSFPDVLDVGGIVLKGAAVGATVSGSIWFDPVSKTGGTSGYNTGYELDVAPAFGCADGTPNNATIGTIMSGGGGASSTSLLGSSASGLLFSLGE